MIYRPEIDGLRAIAVISVILFHAGFEIFSGGYVGVDVFFVISGFLITSIILSDMDKGQFSLINFYERRVRRILPALSFVMLVCIPFAWVWLTPDSIKDFAQSIVGVSTFSSNIHFWRESGYFDTAAELKPLLHTWSLAVEEQYYILFPIFLLATWRFKKRGILLLLIFVFILSLGSAHWGAYNKPNATFYLLPTRAWEILLGAFVAFQYNYTKTVSKNQVVNNIFSLIGFFLIILSIFLYDLSTPFPSLYAVMPTFGTALIILFAMNGTFIQRFLSSRILVSVGLVSYSAYLWHQPIFAFSRNIIIGDSQGYITTLLCISVLPFSYFTWRFIERPFRNRYSFSRKFVFYFFSSATMIFVIFGVIWSKYNISYSVNNEKLKFIATFSEDKNPRRNECISSDSSYLPPNKSCVLGDATNVIGVLWGDSHSDAIAYSLDQELSKIGVGLHHTWYSGCPPILGVYRADQGGDNKCKQYNDEVLNFLRNNKGLAVVVMHARWPVYFEGSWFDNGEGGFEGGISRQYPPPLVLSSPKSDEEPNLGDERPVLLKDKLVQTGKILHSLNKKLVVVYSVPEVGWNVPSHLIKKMNSGIDADISTSFDMFLLRNKTAYYALNTLKKEVEFEAVFPHLKLCNPNYGVVGRCMASKNGIPLYRDDEHLSSVGAKLFVGDIVSAILKMRIEIQELP